MESEIEHLYRIDKFMESMSDMDRLLEAIISEASAATDAESCSLALHDEESDELYFYVARGKKGEGEVERKVECIRMKMGTGIVGWAATHKKTVNIKNAYEDPRFCTSVDEKTGFTTRSVLVVPMLRREKLIGVVEAVNSRNQQGFSKRDEKVLTVLAAQAALVIENARLFEENLRQARFSALGQGVAGSAHCIKNILNGIDGGSYILDLGLKRQNTESVTKGWGIMKRNVKFMKELVLDMLAYSRPTELDCKPTDVNNICTDVADLMYESGRQKSVEIILDLQPDLEEYNLDPKCIYRCVLNIVSNAVDACDKPDGTVKINTSSETNTKVQISISDNGCGIKDDDLKNVFKVFFTTKGSKGTGLGLAVTQKIISDHGGDIRAESKLGIGTKFIITLPTDL